jgi:hypothetical protein
VKYHTARNARGSPFLKVRIDNMNIKTTAIAALLSTLMVGSAFAAEAATANTDAPAAATAPAAQPAAKAIHHAAKKQHKAAAHHAAKGKTHAHGMKKAAAPAKTEAQKG